MDTIVLDQALREKLRNLDRDIEVRDEAGRTVGYFLPHDVYLQLVYAWAKAEVSDEELEEARREIDEHGGVATADILARLRAIRPPQGGAA